MNLGPFFQNALLITEVNTRVNSVKSKGFASAVVKTPVKSSTSSFYSILTNAVGEKRKSFAHEDDMILMVLLKAVLDSLIPDTNPRRAFFGNGAEQNLEKSGQLWNNSGEVELNIPLSTFLKLLQEDGLSSFSSSENEVLRPQVKTREIPLSPNDGLGKRDAELLLEILKRLKSGEDVEFRVGDTVITLKLERIEGGSVDLGDSTVTSKLRQVRDEEINRGVKPAMGQKQNQEILSQTNAHAGRGPDQEAFVLKLSVRHEKSSNNNGIGDLKVLATAEPFSAGSVISKAREKTEPVCPGRPSKNARVFGRDSARERNSKGKILESSEDGEKLLVQLKEQLSGLVKKHLKSAKERSSGTWVRKMDSDNKVVREPLDPDLQSSLQPAESKGTRLNASISKSQTEANQTTGRNWRNVTASGSSQRQRGSLTDVRSAGSGAISIGSGESLKNRVEELLNRFTNLKLRFFQITSKIAFKPLPVTFRSMWQGKGNSQFGQLSAGRVYHDLPSRVVTRIESGTQEKAEFQRVRSQQSQRFKAKTHQFSFLSHQAQSLNNSPKAVDTADVTSLTQRIQEMVKKTIDSKSDVISMRFQLVPKELGKLELEIVREAEKSYRVIFTLHRDEAREIVEKSLPILRERLREEGVEHVKFEFTQGKEWAQNRESEENPNNGHQQRGAYRQRNSDFKAFLKEVSEDDQRSG